MTTLTLYHHPQSRSASARVLLEALGVDYTVVPLDFSAGQTRTPEFLAVNPAGKVPVLMIDGRPLTEVAGILFYLARAFPAAKLLPESDIHPKTLFKRNERRCRVACGLNELQILRPRHRLGVDLKRTDLNGVCR